MSDPGIDPTSPDAETLQAARRALAADLHDGLGAALTYARFRLPLLADAIAAADRGGAERHLGELREALGQAQAALREAVTDLRLGGETRSLTHALRECVHDFEQRSPVLLEYINELPGLALPPGQTAEIVHIAQEALRNIARHAQARRARMQLCALAGGLRLFVEDDGVGLDTAAPAAAGHHGLAIMRERAARLGGTLKVESPADGGGTRITLELALPTRPQDGQTGRAGQAGQEEPDEQAAPDAHARQAN
jgi:two-component system nitrate/nitrite sensor histidine kinase NarX